MGIQGFLREGGEATWAKNTRGIADKHVAHTQKRAKERQVGYDSPPTPPPFIFAG